MDQSIKSRLVAEEIPVYLMGTAEALEHGTEPLTTPRVPLSVAAFLCVVVYRVECM